MFGAPSFSKYDLALGLLNAPIQRREDPLLINFMQILQIGVRV